MPNTSYLTRYIETVILFTALHPKNWHLRLFIQFKAFYIFFHCIFVAFNPSARYIYFFCFFYKSMRCIFLPNKVVFEFQSTGLEYDLFINDLFIQVP